MPPIKLNFKIYSDLPILNSHSTAQMLLLDSLNLKTPLQIA